MPSICQFSARIVSGSGRGRTIGSPTINVHLHDVPADLATGIYACRAVLDGTPYPAALFFGPRPVFHDTPSCEVYVIDTVPLITARTLTVEVVGYIREVRDFATVADLQKQIAIDVTAARAMLAIDDTAEMQSADS